MTKTPGFQPCLSNSFMYSTAMPLKMPDKEKHAYCSNPSAGPPGRTSEMTIDVSPFSKWGLSLPPETAIPNPRFESFRAKPNTTKIEYTDRNFDRKKEEEHECSHDVTLSRYYLKYDCCMQSAAETHSTSRFKKD